jgi:peptidoglycan hydrolase-like protein with peptidoglycan-binding domain
MSDDKTPKLSDAKASDTEPVSPAPKEPKQTSAKSAGAKPAPAKIARDSVVGAGETDPVHYSKARKPGRNENRKSLTVLHIQRRLMAEGFAEAASAPGGAYEVLTERAVAQYQESRGYEPTGVLTRGQFAELFEGDPNVTVVQDWHEDHAV